MTLCSFKRPSTCHAVVAVLLQFFSWGLITAPMITMLNTTFGSKALMMNGVIMAVKGFLSFLSAPLIGSLSDVWGRKMFLLVTAFFTCLPIPFLLWNSTVYFVALTLSGIFSIIFSVAFAYVSDVTDEASRSLGYGMVTAGFAASLIVSPALGAGVEMVTGREDLVIILASLTALLDVAFILLLVPESLDTKVNFKSLTFKQVDPFSSLQQIWADKTVLVISLVTFLSYLPEAGQSTCFFVYLTLVLGFSKINVAIFICYVGLVSALCQTVVLNLMIQRIGAKYSIVVGLSAQLAQLVCYGLTTSQVAVWVGGLGVALSSITYAAISAFASIISDKDKQGAVQGTLMGVRGLCNGLGPAAFGLMWHLFGIDIVSTDPGLAASTSNNTEVFLGGNSSLSINNSPLRNSSEGDVISIDKGIASQMPGLPFLIISSSVVLALICSKFLENITIDAGKTKKEGDCEDTESDKSNVDVPLATEEAVKSDLNRNLDLNILCDKGIEVGAKS